MKLKRIVFMGTPEFSVPILAMLDENYQIVLVVTQPDKRVGRKQVLMASPVKKLAQEKGLTVFQPTNIRNDFNPIIAAKPDIIITAAYGQIIPNEVLATAKSINVHASLLPKYRGGAPITKALFEGDGETGVTLMYMVEKMDAGAILYQKTLRIHQNDNLTTLTKKLSLLGTKLLEEKLH